MSKESSAAPTHIDYDAKEPTPYIPVAGPDAGTLTVSRCPLCQQEMLGIDYCDRLRAQLAAAHEKIRRLEHEMACQNGDADYGN